MNVKRLGYAVVAGAVLLLVFASLASRRIGRAPVAAAPDLSQHPEYSQYEFGKGADVVDVGIQPLWIPTCIISEAMRRDEVLTAALAKRNLAARFHPFRKGADVNFFLERGDLEAGIGGDMPALCAAARSNVLVAGLIQQGFCAIVARRHMLLRDMQGKSVGYALGSNAHYALLEALASAGVRESHVRMVPLDVHEMPDALAQSEIDAFAAWEPTPTISGMRFKDHVVVHRSLSSGYLYFVRPFADRRPEAMRLVTAALVRAMRWLGRSEGNLLAASQWALEAGQAMWKRTPGLSARHYASLAKNDLLGVSWLPAIPETSLARGSRLYREFEFLKGLGQIPEEADWDKVRRCFDRSVVEQVVADASKLQLATYAYGRGGSREP